MRRSIRLGSWADGSVDNIAWLRVRGSWSTIAEKFQWRGLTEAAVTASVVRKQREMTAGVWLTSPFYSTQDHKQRDSAAQIHYRAQDSLADRDPVMLTISINRGAMLEDLAQNLKLSRIVSP